MVGMKSMFWQQKELKMINIVRECFKSEINRIAKGTSPLTSSPLVSSQRPKTEFAAASTEHLEFNVVVIPA